VVHERLTARDIDRVTAAQERVVYLSARVFVLSVTDRAECGAHDQVLADLPAEPAVQDVGSDVAAAAVVGDLHHGRAQEATLHRVIRGLLEPFRAYVGCEQDAPARLQLSVLHDARLVRGRSRVRIIRERLDVPILVKIVPRLLEHAPESAVQGAATGGHTRRSLVEVGDESDVAVPRGCEDREITNLIALEHVMNIRALSNGFFLEADEAGVHRPHLLNKPIAGVALVEVPDGLGCVFPRPIHPEILDLHRLHHLDEAGRVVIVGVREHHMVDVEPAPIMRADVLNDLLTGLGVSAINHVDKDAPVGIGRVLNTDSVPVAFAHGQKIDLEHTQPPTLVFVAFQPPLSGVPLWELQPSIREIPSRNLRVHDLFSEFNPLPQTTSRRVPSASLRPTGARQVLASQRPPGLLGESLRGFPLSAGSVAASRQTRPATLLGLLAGPLPNRLPSWSRVAFLPSSRWGPAPGARPYRPFSPSVALVWRGRMVCRSMLGYFTLLMASISCAMPKRSTMTLWRSFAWRVRAP
jgi:hypothetical protein